MDVNLLFTCANLLALAGWALLLASPLIPTVADRLAGFALPLLLSVAYAGLVLAFWSRAGGGFGSLDDVAILFETPQLLLAGWLHYLAFDLLLGAWEVRTARHEGLPFLLVVPCLALTFLFGPAGYLAFMAVRAAFGSARLARTA
jgi:hypothetical protein